MADTSYGVNHPLAVKAWSKTLFKEALQGMWFSKFIGDGQASVIQTKNELRKSAGDRIRVGLRVQLTGAGIQGDATLEGNEEALSTYYDDLLINQVRHAVVSGGKMSEQRVPFSVRREAMEALADWWAKRDEVAIANHLCGNSAETNTVLTGNNSTTAPTTNRILVANGETAESSLSTSTVHAFSLTLLDRAVARAKAPAAGVMPIRPVRVKGSEYFVAFLHPNQVYQMRTSTSTAQWADIQKAAMAGQTSADNPIFTGMLGIYNGVVLHECPYLPAFTLGGSGTNNARRGVFAGAQAAIWGSGQDNADTEMSWSEEMFDYGNRLGVKAGRIYGVKKTVFNSEDFGVITMASYSPNP
jgi:N4-gp56 family major capsid protein